jgi:transcriptional regulator with XRE-family HTH domain
VTADQPSATDIALGAAIRAARFARGMTQEDLAARVGITRASVASYETGRRKVSAEVLIQIARACAAPLASFDPSVPSSAASPAMPTPEQAAVQTIIRILEVRPDAIPFVLELLEAFVQEPVSHIE